MKKYTYTEMKDTRSGFGDGLTELGKTNPNVVALCADLIGSLKMNDFKENHPDRFFQVGIAEANMMGIAAGLTIGGKIPFTGTFANFSTGRVYDQIRQSIAYSDKNVKICASHAGLTLGEDGATHQILEDIGLMKMLPGMTVINIHTIKPLDEESILKSISKTGCIVTAEEHNKFGGLGESVARCLAENNPIPQEFVAVNDTFGESATPSQLMEKYNINDEAVVNAVMKVLKRK